MVGQQRPVMKKACGAGKIDNYLMFNTLLTWKAFQQDVINSCDMQPKGKSISLAVV